MILAHKEYPATYENILVLPAWRTALEWIKNMPTDLTEGEHEINGRDMYANVHSADLLPRTEAVFEAHQNYIDLHYCLAGGEVIEWMPVDLLKPKTEYDEAKDYTLYEPPAEATSCLMTPHSFAIFLPADAHMPKITDGKHTKVRKVVIKIKTSLLNSH